MLTIPKSLAVAALALCSPALGQTGTKHLFIFGDSYTASGFSSTGALPSPANPIGNPAPPGSGFSGGASWPVQLVTDLNTSTTYLYNFAVGGATVDTALVEPPGQGIPSFIEQVTQWDRNVKNRAQGWNRENTLAGAFFGINDILQKYWKGQDAPLTAMADRFIGQFDRLYAAGVRNFFVITVPPLDKVPQIANQNAAGRQRVMNSIRSFNSQVATKLEAFKQSKGDVRAVVVDSGNAINTAVGNPRAYGAPDATCTNYNGRSCLWWDALHPGTAIQRLFAEDVAKAWKGSFF
ncbi:GDSL lipase/esterase [Podospora fimiseda]|uniref:GDSL lipase/esterase n=1 Tax=Podospora fimiseda TaxID=252190 RepID=A0AAN7BSK9_9PEZI|nr:GDSL lipase/esterase [Podospora fimiseda]